MTSTALSTDSAGSQPLRNKRHERFARRYIVDRNATRAYLTVKPDVGVPSAGTEGWKWLKKPEIAARVAWLEAELAERAAVDGAAALRRQEERGRALLTDVMEWDGDGELRLRPSADLTAAEARGLKSIQIEETETVSRDGERTLVRRRVKVQQHDAKAADDTVLRATGYLDGDGEVGGNVQKVFLLPVVALNAQDWQARVAERRALPAGAVEIKALESGGGE